MPRLHWLALDEIEWPSMNALRSHEGGSVRNQWELYARSVAGIDQEHRDACVANQGASGTAGLRQDIRWPGFLGSAYGSRDPRLLCVGQVHHGADLLATLGNIQPALEQLGAGSAPQPMQTVTTAYERAIIRWGPWVKFRKILTPLGLDERSIAYTNVAKCWQTLSEQPDCRLPMRACAQRFPLDQLAVSIDAQAIVIMSVGSTLAYAGISEGTVPIFSFPGRPSNAELAQITRDLHDRFVRKG